MKTGNFTVVIIGDGVAIVWEGKSRNEYLNAIGYLQGKKEYQFHYETSVPDEIMTLIKLEQQKTLPCLTRSDIDTQTDV